MALLQPGWTYRFSFKSQFAPLDGTYTVLRMYTYPELLKDNIDLYEQLYVPQKLTQEQYDKDCVTYFSEGVYKLADPEDEDNLVYAPESILVSIPVYNVQQYSNIAIAFHLGHFKSGDELQPVLNNLSQEISAALGVDQEPRAMVVGKQYFTDDEYSKITAERKNRMTTILNHFSENVKLRNEILNLKAKIVKLEEYIKQLSRD